MRAVSSTPLRLARPRESHARPRARARRTAARRASGPRSGQDPGDDEGEFEPARWLRNTANVSFWRTETDAENAEAEYREFAEARGRTYDGRLFRAGSAVTAFEQTPDAAERDTIARCL
ncbi:MAG: hypothetical protein H0T96_07945 [Thermoleophilaceae bacterium]|nr:hypothetical protein [Thermoleophilaceae bacterium]